MTERPAPEGFEWVWVEEDSDAWRSTIIGSPHCRSPKCDNLAVVQLKRGRAGWWSYCREHMYGRRLVDGRIEGLRLRPATREEASHD